MRGRVARQRHVGDVVGLGRGLHLCDGRGLAQPGQCGDVERVQREHVLVVGTAGARPEVLQGLVTRTQRLLLGAGHPWHVEPHPESLRERGRRRGDVPDRPVLVAVPGVDQDDRVALRAVGTRPPGERRRDVVARFGILLAGVLDRDVAVVRERRALERERTAAATTTGEVQPYDHVVDDVRRAAGLVVVGVAQPQAAVRRLDDVAQPAPLAVEEGAWRVGTRAGAVDVHDPQPRTAYGRHVEPVVDDLQAAGRGRGDVPGTDRVDEAGVAARALTGGP